MAKKTIRLRIDVTKINKEWLYKGEKGTYLDCTLLFNDEKDQYGDNGMIVQSVPKAIYEKEKDTPKEQRTKGPILGNGSEYVPAGRESSPAQASAPAAQAAADDLPF